MRDLHLPEWVKNLLIIGLSISAVYLFTLSPLYLNSPIRGWTTRLLAGSEGSGPVSVSLTTAAQPTRMAVSSSAGRYGVQYDPATLSALFEQTRALLGEALGGAAGPVQVSETRWRQALSEQGIYFDFSGFIPFSALTGWLWEGGQASALTGDVRRLALAPGDDGETVWLYWQDAGERDVFYACATGLTVAAHLEPVAEEYIPNGAKFAFEDGALAPLDPYTLITDSPGEAAVYTASSPLVSGGEEVQRQVRAALSFSGALVTEYAMGDSMVYRAGEDTLTLEPGGTLSYHSSNGGLYPVASEGQEPTLAEMIETTRQLTASVLGPLCGEAELYLISALQEEGETVITYGYSLNGAAVWAGDDGWAARFQLTGGALTGFTMDPRSYTATGAAVPLLPSLQAAAAIDALDAGGSELLLVYRDLGGETLSVGWIAA